MHPFILKLTTAQCVLNLNNRFDLLGENLQQTQEGIEHNVFVQTKKRNNRHSRKRTSKTLSEGIDDKSPKIYKRKRKSNQNRFKHESPNKKSKVEEKTGQIQNRLSRKEVFNLTLTQLPDTQHGEIKATNKHVKRPRETLYSPNIDHHYSNIPRECMKIPDKITNSN